MTRKKPYFITIEGIEGVGKSTSLEFIQRTLQKLDIPFITTREPGGTPVAEAIRQVLLNKYPEPMLHETELLLMFASRAQHLASVIQPALQAGQWVVCDRFTDASYAYQGAGRGIAIKHIAMLESWVQGSLRPDLTLLLDAPVKIALKRARRRAHPDRIESEQAHFFHRVREGYLARAATHAKQYRIIDAAQSRRMVKMQIQEVLMELVA